MAVGEEGDDGAVRISDGVDGVRGTPRNGEPGLDGVPGILDGMPGILDGIVMKGGGVRRLFGVPMTLGMTRYGGGTKRDKQGEVLEEDPDMSDLLASTVSTRDRLGDPPVGAACVPDDDGAGVEVRNVGL